jgi:ABC-2 type transport system ATP-binding protein
MISVKNLSKNFGHLQVLNDISFEIKTGEIVGFLGQNGAGKTTLMRILTTYLSPSKGEVIVANEDIKRQSLKVRQKIGYLPENPPLYQNLTVKSYLRLAARLREISSKEESREVERVLSVCDLKNVEDQTIWTLSKGYKQRVGIAQAIIHNPEVLILDEPTSGLDPVQNLQVRNLIKNLEHKRTVILSTHVLSEIEHIARRVLIIKKGRIIKDENLSELLQKENAKSLEDVFLRAVSNDHE